jgi:polysaccharide export outer membrane protein
VTWLCAVVVAVSLLGRARADEPVSALVEGWGAAEAPSPAAIAAYRVGAGDVLQVEVYGEKELSGTFPSDSTGSLDYPLLGRVSVLGLMPAEVAALLRTRLMAGYVVSPSVTVTVATYRSQPVQVLGAVARPGVYHLRGPTTLLQVISEAGGVAPVGVNEVRLTRGSQADKVAVIPWDEILASGRGDVELASGDVIFVPQSLISVSGQVARPGEIAFREGMTLSRCIAAAGGALPAARLGEVIIMRGDQRIAVNLRAILRGRTLDVPMASGDKVYVQQSVF